MLPIVFHRTNPLAQSGAVLMAAEDRDGLCERLTERLIVIDRIKSARRRWMIAMMAVAAVTAVACASVLCVQRALHSRDRLKNQEPAVEITSDHQR